MDRLQAVLHALGGDKNKLVIDLSCRKKDNKWFVATNKWQTITDFEDLDALIASIESQRVQLQDQVIPSFCM